MEKARHGRMQPRVDNPVVLRPAGLNSRERILRISGELDEENYRAYVKYSNSEYRFGSPEATDDSHSLDLTLKKGLSYPYPVYTHTCSNRYILRRALSDIREIPAKACIISIIISGHLTIRQNGDVMTMSSNQMTLIDLTEPYMIEIFPPPGAEFKSIFTYVPARMIRPEACPRMPCILDMDEYEVSAMSSLLFNLFENGFCLSYQSSVSMFDAIISQINSEIKHNKRCHLRDSHIVTADDDRWHQIVSYVNLMYSNSLLDAVSVAKEVGISQRSLNYLFAKHGTTFSKTLWDLRLSVVRNWLSDPSMDGVAIQQLAIDAGFKSAAHLSTFFKSRTGCTPREFRQCRRQQ